MESAPKLRISPEEELYFQATPDAQSHVSLRLENPHQQQVAFKIKTTAPKSYLVKPSSGVISSKSTVEINLLLIPQYDSFKDFQSDRFLVQSAFVSSDRVLSKEEWAECPKELLDERKLIVKVEWTGGTNAGAQGGAINAAPTTSSSGCTAGLVHKPIPQEYKQLRQMYEELVKHTLSLDKAKRELETEMDALKIGGRTNASSSASVGSKGPITMEIWQVGLLVLGVAIVIRALH